MTYTQFLDHIIDDGKAAVMKDYADDRDKREGSLEGFEACRGKSPEEIAGLLYTARRRSGNARNSDSYWRERCRELEIEWVANVVSVILKGEFPIITPPTARGAMKAVEILGRE